MTSKALATLDHNPAPLAVRQVETDAQLIETWVSAANSPHSRRARRFDADAFTGHVGKPLAHVTVRDLQAYRDSLDALADLSPATKGRRLAHVKSILAYGHRLGWLQFNVGAALKVAAIRNILAERIIDEASVHKLVAKAEGRNALVLRVLYVAGLRAAELTGLRWRDLSARNDAGQLAIFGKGGKSRSVLLSAATWRELIASKPEGAKGDDFVFLSRTGRQLDTTAIGRIVKAAAKVAGLPANISPHWLRHACASHALDRGAKIHVVQASLGHSSVATTGRYLHARPNDGAAMYLGL